MSKATAQRPALNLGFMLPRFSRWVSLGLGSGLAPLVPGTAGTLAAWLIHSIFLSRLSDGLMVALLLACFALGCWATQRVSDDLGVADHGAIVWDEFVAFWLVLTLVPTSFGWQFSAFALFRFFDMVKPPPIRWFDRHVKGGLGIMLDDIIAALFTLFVLAWFR